MDEDKTSPPWVLIDPDKVTAKFVVDEDCTPCHQIRKHLNAYGGKYEVIDPSDPRIDHLWENDNLAFPVALIERDGKEIPCEIFMDEENLVLKCSDKELLVIT